MIGLGHIGDATAQNSTILSTFDIYPRTQLIVGTGNHTRHAWHATAPGNLIHQTRPVMSGETSMSLSCIDSIDRQRGEQKQGHHGTSQHCDSSIRKTTAVYSKM
jgi:hypothetical protein